MVLMKCRMHYWQIELEIIIRISTPFTVPSKVRAGLITSVFLSSAFQFLLGNVMRISIYDRVFTSHTHEVRALTTAQTFHDWFTVLSRAGVQSALCSSRTLLVWPTR
jgi:hypothetical protein